MRKDKFQKLIGVFLLFAVLLNFPFIGLFNKHYSVLGVPFVYIYIFFIWLLMIGLMAWIVEKRGN